MDTQIIVLKGGDQMKGGNNGSPHFLLRHCSKRQLMTTFFQVDNKAKMKRTIAAALALLVSLAVVNCGHYVHYIEDRDFSDYSSHYTRTDAANRNSAAAPPASGPYFAFELKEMAQQWNSLDYYDYFALPQTAVDYSGNAFHPQQFYPPMTYKRPTMIAPYKKRRPNRPKIPQKTKGCPIKINAFNTVIIVNSIEPTDLDLDLINWRCNWTTAEVEKIDDDEEDSLTSLSSPNGVMGVVSLVAGIVWFLVNKSATPVVKMRADSDARDASDRVNLEQLTSAWSPTWSPASLQDPQCQRRAICDLVNQRPSFLSYAQIIQSVLRLVAYQYPSNTSWINCIISAKM